MLFEYGQTVVFMPRSGDDGEPLPPVISQEIEDKLAELGHDQSYSVGYKRSELDAGVLAGMAQVDRWREGRQVECDQRLAELRVVLADDGNESLDAGDPPAAGAVAPPDNMVTVEDVADVFETRRRAAARQEAADRRQTILRARTEAGQLELRKTQYQSIADLAVQSWGVYREQIVAMYMDAASQSENVVTELQHLSSRLDARLEPYALPWEKEMR